jgi:hypothetical protein
MKPRRMCAVGAAGVLAGGLLVTATGAFGLTNGSVGQLNLNAGESLSVSCGGPSVSWLATKPAQGTASCAPVVTTSTTVPRTTTTTIDPPPTTVPATTTTVPATTTTVPPPPKPPLATSVSANGRYLLDQNGKPFLVNGDSAWFLAPGLSAADQATYLADRAANGFNTVGTNLIGIGPVDGSDIEGDVPFTGGNFATPNSAYWSRIDTFFRAAEADGISVFAIPVPASLTASGQLFANMTNAQAQTFGTFLSNRYPQSQWPGIVWMLGGDYAGDGAGTGQSGFLSQYQALLAGFAAAGDHRPTDIEQGYNESLSTDGSTLGQRVTTNAVYTYHPTYEGTLRAYATKAIPAVFIEGTYENNPFGFPGTALDIRKPLLWTMTSGGAGSFYGNDSLWEFPAGWRSQLDTSDVAQRKAIDAAFAGINWSSLQPDTGSRLVTAGRNTEGFGFASAPKTPYTDDATYGWYVTAAYSPDGSLGLIYNPDTTRNHITVSAAALGSNPTITAIDPTNGAATSLGWTTTPTMGANAGGDHDWLFVITAGRS